MRYAILALDIATTTGWAFGEPDTEPEWGSASFPKRKFKGLGARLNAYQSFVRGLIINLGPTVIVMEKPFINRKKPNLHTSRLSLTQCGIVEMAADDLGDIPIYEVDNNKWKMTFIGHARSKDIKADCIHKCRQHGWDVDEENEADALGVLQHSCETFAQQATRFLGEAVA